MNLTAIPLIAMLRDRLGYLSDRQRVIAQNVANSDTAGYVGQDLKPFAFQVDDQAQRASNMAITHAGHLPAGGGRSVGGTTYKTIKTPGSEVTVNGNAVVLEEEMIKMSDARMSYDAAIGFYQKSLNLLRLATKPPGRV